METGIDSNVKRYAIDDDDNNDDRRHGRPTGAKDYGGRAFAASFLFAAVIAASLIVGGDGFPTR